MSKQVYLLDVLVDVVPGPVTVAVLGGGTGLVVFESDGVSSSSITTVPASVCPSLISNPSYTPPAVLPDDYTWDIVLPRRMNV
jgi:hypothetical protein